ncbi:PP2C family serine/threonine-protein phosphatase [Novosphingobium sp. Gsoil 351]|uniref:PP2C family protein-serine/threonine phosphatase n=1 Tax=Novosphingobium sp. Gsoil 351 TaxID=2675225 RepID=UPI0018A868D9|nr:protein phosphatase 2C domain-containing protein [Novosphingobium sp. Gsoil 351]
MTDVGHVRANNEDSIAVAGTDAFPLFCWEGELALRHGWALVGDGMGGHVAGEAASQLAIELLRPVMSQLTNSEQVTAALQAVNEALFDIMERHPALAGMGTTIAGVILLGDRALVFNLGDSRVYLHHQHTLTQLSQDDVIGGNMLTQCPGGLDAPAELGPHVQEIGLAPGAALLLCSDGLTDMLTDAEIAALLYSSDSHSAERVVQAALNAGGIDNVSAVVIHIGNLPFPNRPGFKVRLGR